DLRRHLPGENLIGEFRRRRVFTFGMQRRIAGQKSGIDGPFPENSPEIVGKEKGHEKSIRQNAFAKNPGHQHVAHKTGDARQEREAADGKKPPEHQRPFFAAAVWAINFFTDGRSFATITFTPSGLGCMPSAWLSLGLSATPSRMKG